MGFVGILSQVKFYILGVDKALYDGVFKFQGSDDENTWTDLDTIDFSVNEGWNYFKWPDVSSRPAFRFYRYFGEKAGSCNILEIKLAGVVSTKDNKNS